MIRPALLDDAETIARVAIQVWRETYQGIMTDDYLNNLSLSEREAGIRARLEGLASSRQCFFVSELNGGIVGFVSSGPARGETLSADGEVYAINLLNSVKRQGWGQRLMHYAAAHLDAQGFQSAGLWVLERNLLARAFYEKLGGVTSHSVQREVGGARLNECAVVWKDVGQLIAATRA